MKEGYSSFFENEIPIHIRQNYIEFSTENSEKLKMFYDKYSDFSLQKFYSDVKAAYIEMCNELKEDNASELKNVCTENFINNKNYDDVEYKSLETSNIYNNCKIEYIGYNAEKDNVCVLIKCNFQLKDYNNATGKEITGLTRVVKRQFVITLVNRQRVRKDIFHCSSCGAPLSNILRTTCEHCGAQIKKEYDWLIDDISKL